MVALGLIVGAFVLRVLVVQWIARRTARRAEGLTLDQLDPAAQAMIGDLPYALLYFYSDHCRASRRTTPHVEACAALHDWVKLIDITRHPKVTESFRVRATPTLISFRQGVVRKVQVGSLSRRDLNAACRRITE